MKSYNKILSLSLAGIVVFSSVPGFASAIPEVQKNETVYVNLTEQGDVSEVVVSSWIHADQRGLEIKDQSILENIVNVKGDEKPLIKGQEVTWKMESEDLFYQGTTNKDLPLEVKITYYLDGKEIEGKALVGKSGRLKMTLEVINHSQNKRVIDGETRTIYTPFETICVFTLPMDRFSNVSLNTGKMISDGNNNIVTYLTIPGLKESLGESATSVDLPEKLVVESDVSNFEMGPIMITAMSKFPEIEALKDVEKMSELIDAIEQLNASAVQLVDASEKIKEGQESFDKNFSLFANGFKKYNTGLSQFFDGLTSLFTGVDKAQSGAKSLSNGLSDLNEKISPLIKGLSEYALGGKQFSENAQKFANGALQISEGTAGLTENTLNLYKGSAKVSEGMLGLKVGQSQVTEGLVQSVQGVANLKAVLLQSKGDQDPVYLSLVELEKNLKTLEVGSKTVGAGFDQVTTAQGQVTDGLNQLNQGVQRLKPASEALSKGAKGLSQGAEKLNGASEQLSGGSKGLAEGVQKLAQGAGALETGLSKLSAGAIKAKGAQQQLVNAQSELLNGSEKLLEGSKKLYDGQTKLSEGITKFQKEGTERMHEEVKRADASMEGFLSVKDEWVSLSKAYDHFSGLGENMAGEVKFVMKTESLKAVEIENKEVVVQKEKKQGFFEWVKSFFN